MNELRDWEISQEERMRSFKYWPFKKGPCRPEKMAEAGFYSLGSKSEPDLAKCYVCFKELDGWEKDDDPWSEHKKHAPQCAFVLLGKMPAELTVKDVCTLEVDRMKKFVLMNYEKNVKVLNDLKEVVIDELDKYTTKGSKENRKQKTSRAPKRSSRRD